MKHFKALELGSFFVSKLSPFCEPDRCIVAGGVRRGKSESHDLEIVCQPNLAMKPRAQFGMKVSELPSHMLAMALIELEEEEYLIFKQGAERNRKYWINLEKFGMDTTEEFMLDLWITMPPAQFGVNVVIRTGPNSREDKFSKWVVTPRANGGCLPDGYCVRDCAVWRIEQIHPETDRPLKGEMPLEMSTEKSFMDFLGIDATPADRHAIWWKWSGVKAQYDKAGEA